MDTTKRGWTREGGRRTGTYLHLQQTLWSSRRRWTMAMSSQGDGYGTCTACFVIPCLVARALHRLPSILLDTFHSPLALCSTRYPHSIRFASNMERPRACDPHSFSSNILAACFCHTMNRPDRLFDDDSR